MNKILINGKIYTMDPTKPKAEAIRISDGRISAVGTNEEILAKRKEDDEILDMHEMMVLPGLIDAHCHPAMSAYFLNALQFNEEQTLEEMMEELKKYVQQNPEKENYLGAGYNELCFADIDYSTEMLDEIYPGKPVFLFSSGCHSGWANSCAFEYAGITKDTPDPIPRFQYFEKSGDGELTGHVVETEAENMIFRKINFFDDELLENAYCTMAEDYSSLGVTTLVGCGNFDWMGYKPYEIPEKLVREDRLKVRLFDCSFVESRTRKNTALEDLRSLSKKYNSDRLRVNTFKIIMDGTFESASASMAEKYIDEYEVIHPLFEGDEIVELFLQVASEGFDIHSHGIGNYAIHENLRGAQAVREAGYMDTRITNAHTQYVSKEDRKRFGELNVIANTSGGWHYWYPGIDKVMGKLEEDEFTIKEIIDGGAIMTMGSDRPADEVGFDPRVGIATAMTRKYMKPVDGVEMIPLKPDNQKLALWECLEAYTVNAARQIHMEGKLGQIIPGAYADIAVFEKDMFRQFPDEIMSNTVKMTFFEGELVSNIK